MFFLAALDSQQCDPVWPHDWTQILWSWLRLLSISLYTYELKPHQACSGLLKDFEIWADTLKGAETKYNHEAFQALQGEQWAAPLLRKIEQNGGILSAPMPLRLEIRIAYAFQQNGIEPQYKFAASSGTKSVDFHVHGSPEWLIEVVSLRESDAIKDATLRDGLLTSVILSSLSADPKQSEEGEVVRAMEHIADKAEKFPIPSPGAFHVILVDMRGYVIRILLLNTRLRLWSGLPRSTQLIPLAPELALAHPIEVKPRLGVSSKLFHGKMLQ